MDCNEVRALLDEYITDELDMAIHSSVAEHLDTCGDCGREYQELLRLKKDVAALAQPLPEGFKAKLEARVRGDRFRRLPSWFGTGVAAAVVAVCMVSIGYFGLPIYNKEEIPQAEDVGVAIASAQGDITDGMDAYANSGSTDGAVATPRVRIADFGAAVESEAAADGEILLDKGDLDEVSALLSHMEEISILSQEEKLRVQVTGITVDELQENLEAYSPVLLYFAPEADTTVYIVDISMAQP